MIFLSFLFEKKCFRFVTDIIGKENKKGMNVSLYLEESDAKIFTKTLINQSARKGGTYYEIGNCETSL